MLQRAGSPRRSQCCLLPTLTPSECIRRLVTIAVPSRTHRQPLLIPMSHLRAQLLDKHPRRLDILNDKQRRIALKVLDVGVAAVVLAQRPQKVNVAVGRCGVDGRVAVFVVRVDEAAVGREEGEDGGEVAVRGGEPDVASGHCVGVSWGGG